MLRRVPPAAAAAALQALSMGVHESQSLLWERMVSTAACAVAASRAALRCAALALRDAGLYCPCPFLTWSGSTFRPASSEPMLALWQGQPCSS